MDAETTSRDDIRSVLIAGATHGNTAWVETLTWKAAERGCKKALVDVPVLDMCPTSYVANECLTPTACA